MFGSHLKIVVSTSPSIWNGSPFSKPCSSSSVSNRTSSAPPSRGTNGPEQMSFPCFSSPDRYARWRSTVCCIRSSGNRYFNATKAYMRGILLRAQRLGRLDLRRPSCGQPAREERDAAHRRDERRVGQRIGEAHAVHHRRDRPHERDGREATEHDARGREPHAFAEHHAHELARL